MKFPAFEPIDLKNNVKSGEITELYLTQIEPDKNQPRKNFDENSLIELSLSIKQHGIIQPILVKKLDHSFSYQIIAGERRWRAAKMVGLEKIPAIVKEYDKVNILAVSLIENIQRDNLNSLEEAQAIQRLLEECYMTHSQVAENLGKSRTTITNLLRLLALTREVKELINSGSLEMGHARALLSLPPEQQVDAAKQIISKSLSVRETEKLVQRINMPSEYEDKYIDVKFEKEIKDWGKLLSQQLASRVTIQVNQDGQGKVVINFASTIEANWLMKRLVVAED